MKEHSMSRLSRLEVQIENIEKSLDVVQAETKANNQLCNELNKSRFNSVYLLVSSYRSPSNTNNRSRT